MNSGEERLRFPESSKASRLAASVNAALFVLGGRRHLEAICLVERAIEPVGGLAPAGKVVDGRWVEDASGQNAFENSAFGQRCALDERDGRRTLPRLRSHNFKAPHSAPPHPHAMNAFDCPADTLIAESASPRPIIRLLPSTLQRFKFIPEQPGDRTSSFVTDSTRQAVRTARDSKEAR